MRTNLAGVRVSSFTFGVLQTFLEMHFLVWRFFYAICCCTLALTVSCASTTNPAKDEAMPAVDISRFGTYDWIDEARDDSEEARRLLERFPQVDEIVANTVDSLLQAKGYAKSSSNPDFRVTYLLAVEDRLVSGQNRNRARQFREGTLIVDFVDPATDKIIWTGSGDGIVEERRSALQRRRLVEQGLQRIFEFLPASRETR